MLLANIRRGLSLFITDLGMNRWLESFFKVACITGASWAKRGKRGILRVSRFTRNAAFASFGSEALIQGGDPYDAEIVL